MSGELLLVPLTEDLLPQVLELEKQCFSLPWSRDAFLPELTDPDCFWLAALLDGAVAGYIGFRAVLDEGYISNVAVSPDRRRQGIASALLEAVIREARRRSLSFLTLEVRVGNASAIRLYSGFGFREVGLRPGYYERPREDALLMTRFFAHQGSSET
jgi:ribosomal-protein-alanine N-acetyltransferase